MLFSKSILFITFRDLYFIVKNIEVIPVSILKASLEMVLYTRGICKKSIIFIKNIYSVVPKLDYNIAGKYVIIFSTIVEYQILSISFLIPQDFVIKLQELWYKLESYIFK